MVRWSWEIEFSTKFKVKKQQKKRNNLFTFCAGWVYAGARVIRASWEAVPDTAALHHRLPGVGRELWAFSRTPASVRPAQIRWKRCILDSNWTVYLLILAGQKKMLTTVFCTTMSTTRTTTWSTPCSVRFTVARLKHKRTQRLLTKRFFISLYSYDFHFDSLAYC